MCKKAPRYIKTTLNQIEWYEEQLDYINKLPTRKINIKLLRIRKHYIREITLLTQEITNKTNID